jgi:hypothetical protein
MVLTPFSTRFHLYDSKFYWWRKAFCLVFGRSVLDFSPLHFDNDLFIELLFWYLQHFLQLIKHFEEYLWLSNSECLLSYFDGISFKG